MRPFLGFLGGEIHPRRMRLRVPEIRPRCLRSAIGAPQINRVLTQATFRRIVMRKLFSGCLMVMALVLGAVRPAFADHECGMTTADWNVPNGGVVFNRGDGPIRNVVDAIGEYRTHSMLSHGPGTGMTH